MVRKYKVWLNERYVGIAQIDDENRIKWDTDPSVELKAPELFDNHLCQGVVEGEWSDKWTPLRDKIHDGEKCGLTEWGSMHDEFEFKKIN